jgi:hypothetical protein
MSLSEYISAGRRNVARTGKTGAETDSQEDKKKLGSITRSYLLLLLLLS